MVADRIPDLERRAVIHAALADPARLQIADTLLAGDASPSELAAMLGMPSNLLAHHLHVLEQAGVITRRRSEGDRRRTYLQLIPGPLESLAAPPARAARRARRRRRAGPPGGAPGCAPATSATSSKTTIWSLPCATWPTKNSAAPR